MNNTQTNLVINYELCEALNRKYQELHKKPTAMLGDLQHFFYFTPHNFELYGLLHSIDKDIVIMLWKGTLELNVEDFLAALWLAMRNYGFRHTKPRNKQIAKALSLYM